MRKMLEGTRNVRVMPNSVGNLKISINYIGGNMDKDCERIENIDGALLQCGTQELYDTLEENIEIKNLVRQGKDIEFVAGALYTLDVLYNIITNPEEYFHDEPD